MRFFWCRNPIPHLVPPVVVVEPCPRAPDLEVLKGGGAGRDPGPNLLLEEVVVHLLEKEIKLKKKL